MTDPTGRSFFSYRQHRMDDAALLNTVQRELGIPTWQDVDDLDEEPMEEELKRVLADPETANAILWITPEVEASEMIRQVEAPAVLQRAREDDLFFVVPVAAGGLGYREAAKIVSGHLGAEDLSTWKILVLGDQDLAEDGDRRVLTSRGAPRVAERVLHRRLAALHRSLEASADPLRVRLHTYAAPGFEPGWTLSLDWHHHFSHRQAELGIWDSVLLPRLRTVRRAIDRQASGRPVELSGRCTNSAALALGRTFPSLAPVRCTWRQWSPKGPAQVWHQGAEREETGFRARASGSSLEADGLAVLFSLTEDVEPAFGRSKADLPAFRAILRIGPPPADDGKFKDFKIETPGQAMDIVEIAVDAIRAARREYPVSTIHLFPSIPGGIAFLLGQRLNTLGPIQTYEIREPDSIGKYRPEVLLRAEDF